MKFILYTNSISPHQIPLAKEMVRLLGAENYRYVYQQELSSGRQDLGWSVEKPEWMIPAAGNRQLIESCDVLMCGIRDIALFRKRSADGKKTIYCSERWFKPISVCGLFAIDGRVRMLYPRYRIRARAMMDLVKHDPAFMLYPIGVHAARDFAWLLGCTIERLERVPGGGFWGKGASLNKMRMWGYFVEPSKFDDKEAVFNYNEDALPAEKSDGTLKLLWCGRLLGWKRVRDIVRAVGEHVGLKREGDSLPKISLTIVGDGPEKERHVKMAKGLPITFMPSQPIAKIRELMRAHDLYVLSSNQYEGWGAVVNEALEEGMNVVGTYEAGSSATILSKNRLYHAGNVKELVALIDQEYKGDIPFCSIGVWTAREAAKRLMEFVK